MKKHNEIFTRAVATFVDPDDSFKNKLEAKIAGKYDKDIVIKLGADPTRPDIHLGHAVVLRKLREFQDLGCKIVFIIGDYTTMIGDPTGKSKVRPEIGQGEIEANMKSYIDQIGKILNTDPAVFSWIRNSDWFLEVADISAQKGASIKIEGENGEVTVDANSFVGKAAIFENTRMQKTHLGKNQINTISFTRVLSTLRHITHSRLIERDMFQDRLNSGSELYMHEMMYPVLQGIDSSMLANIYGSCDLEIGGTDQTFNMLIGRDVMRMNKQEEQAVMAMDILEGLDGKEKMSKSLDNYIGITDQSNDMYGKVMSIPDSLIIRYFLLASYSPKEEIADINNKLDNGDLHPRDAKMRLAKEIVAIYWGENLAKEAEEFFIATFSEGRIPDDVLENSFPDGTTILEVLVILKIASSNTEARRLIKDGAVTFMDSKTKITDFDSVVEKGTYRVGKHRFFKVV